MSAHQTHGGNDASELGDAPIDRLAVEDTQRDRLTAQVQQVGEVLRQPLVWGRWEEYRGYVMSHYTTRLGTLGGTQGEHPEHDVT